MKSSPENTKTAIWIPAWYDQDQPVVAKTTTTFFVWNEPPTHLQSACIPEGDYYFANGCCDDTSFLISTTVWEIYHRTYGEILGIYNYHPFEYVLAFDKERRMTINCEEDPGRIIETGELLDDPVLIVTLYEPNEVNISCAQYMNALLAEEKKAIWQIRNERYRRKLGIDGIDAFKEK